MAAAPPALSRPPQAPEVTDQQGPVSQFVSGYQPDESQSGPPPLKLAEQKLSEVAMGLRDVARILVMSKPALMPVLQKMIQAGSMLMNEISKANPQKQQGQPGPPTAGPPAEGPQGAPPGEGMSPGMG